MIPLNQVVSLCFPHLSHLGVISTHTSTEPTLHWLVRFTSGLKLGAELGSLGLKDIFIPSHHPQVTLNSFSGMFIPWAVSASFSYIASLLVGSLYNCMDLTYSAMGSSLGGNLLSLGPQLPATWHGNSGDAACLSAHLQYLFQHSKLPDSLEVALSRQSTTIHFNSA